MRLYQLQEETMHLIMNMRLVTIFPNIAPYTLANMSVYCIVGEMASQAGERSLNCHLRKCTGGGGAPKRDCDLCGEQYRLPESWKIHRLYCSEAGGTLVVRRASLRICPHCGTAWPSQRSLSQHVRNQHMAEDPLVRSQQLPAESSGSQRTVWTDELRARFLEVADQVGWSKHSVIAETLGLSSQQIRNFKLKFPKERWKEGGSEAEDSPTPRLGTPPEAESGDEEGSASGQSPRGDETQQPVSGDALLSADGALAGNHQRRGSDSSGGQNSPRSLEAPDERQAGPNTTTEEVAGSDTLPRDDSLGGHEESGSGGPLGESTTDGSSSSGAESSSPGDGQTGDAAPSPVEELSSEGGQTGDSTSTSADARPARPKKRAGSRKKRQNRKRRKRKSGAGESQGGGRSGEAVAAPAQSQTHSGSRSTSRDRGSQPRSSGQGTGRPLWACAPPKCASKSRQASQSRFSDQLC